MVNLFEISNLYLEYISTKQVSGQKEKIHALNGVSLSIQEGEIIAIAGESGCGKSTLAKVLMKLEKPKSGEIFFNNKNILNFDKLQLQNFRNEVQMIFQNPYASLNPKMKIYEILEEPLIINTKMNSSERQAVISEKISQVGLDETCLDKYPHEFSGGQRQRIAIARALVLNPICLIADEPVSALDVSIQAQIINLLKDLKDKYKLTIIFISHDLRVIKYLADRVAVMYLGEIVELANTKSLFDNPKHPYTQALINAIPTFKEKTTGTNKLLKGDLPSIVNLPKGCLFNSRCPKAIDICHQQHPNLTKHQNNNVRCWLYNSP